MSAVMKISEERLRQVLLAPVVSEKATFIAEKYEQVIFRVLKNATKPEIKAAVENMFKVEVESVQVLNRLGKQKRTRNGMGRKSNQKLAYVCLKPGQEIHFTEEAK